jgi:hypothetical protein
MPSKASSRRSVISTTCSATPRKRASTLAGPTDLGFANVVELHPAQDDQPSDAVLFLVALDPGATWFTFQTFDHDNKRKNPKLIRILHGSFVDLKLELERLNARGAGVFVTINETDGERRKTENIEWVRALFVDLDDAPLKPVLAASPHIVEGLPSPCAIKALQCQRCLSATTGHKRLFGEVSTP